MVSEEVTRDYLYEYVRNWMQIDWVGTEFTIFLYDEMYLLYAT